MEPVGMNVFFLAGTPESLEGNYHTWPSTTAERFSILIRSIPSTATRRLRTLHKLAASDLRTRGSRPIRQRCSPAILGLPALDSRIPQLARQITASADNNYDKARGAGDLSAHSLRL